MKNEKKSPTDVGGGKQKNGILHERRNLEMTKMATAGYAKQMHMI